MLTFITHYWIEFVFGLIATGAVAFARRFKTLYEKEHQHKKEAEQTLLKEDIKNELLQVIKENREESRKGDVQIESCITAIDNEIKILKNGILSIQGNVFKKECKMLLEKEKITLEEMDELSEDYDVYHSLGGNHDGDRLYKDVSIKYRGQLDK